jgi:hypothetical protein
MIHCRNANTTELDNGRRAVTIAKVKTMRIGNTGTNESIWNSTDHRRTVKGINYLQSISVSLGACAAADRETHPNNESEGQQV